MANFNKKVMSEGSKYFSPSVSTMDKPRYTLTLWLTSIRVVNTALVLFMITMSVVHSALFYKAFAQVDQMIEFARIIASITFGVAISFGVLVATVRKNLLVVKNGNKSYHIFPYLIAAFDSESVAYLLNHTPLAILLGAGCGLMISVFAFIFQKQSEPITMLDELHQQTTQAQEELAEEQQKLTDTKQKAAEAEQELSSIEGQQRAILDISVPVIKKLIADGVCPACGRDNLKGGTKSIAGHSNGCDNPDLLKVLLKWIE